MRSVENASAVLNSSIELRNHDLELNYSMIRYVMWVIPTLGFIGTVVGIALALSFAGEPGRSQDPELLTELTQRLAVAFNTTLLALIMAAFLVLLMHIIQSMEERISRSPIGGASSIRHSVIGPEKTVSDATTRVLSIRWLLSP